MFKYILYIYKNKYINNNNYHIYIYIYIYIYYNLLTHMCINYIIYML